jgi:hypothetical protein
MAIHPPKNYKVPALISSALVTRIVSFRIELDETMKTAAHPYGHCQLQLRSFVPYLTSEHPYGKLLMHTKGAPTYPCCRQL